jgi:3D-(3,5/4)-trihydroxycyclohexane-1,2-dione acylhydrolase (decyclizing)
MAARTLFSLDAGAYSVTGMWLVSQALQQYSGSFRYYQARNEQAMVHAAAAYTKMKNRLQAFACTSSIGPGATNMITGAAVATINRLPVLLLPGDIFAERLQAPVLQQVEWEHSQDFSVNDCFKPVSRYWDRINRPEQIIAALPEVMRVLTSPAETGAVTLSLPQDVQAMAYDYPSQLFEKRVWHIPRNRPDLGWLQQAVEWIKQSKQPIIVAGGGVIYSEATETLRRFAEQTGIPVGETMAGKGSLNYNHPLNLGAIGVTGTAGANILAREADLVIGIGTRYSDFTTASKTAFQGESVKFININVAEFDAYKHNALPLVGDARVVLEELMCALSGYQTSQKYQNRATEYNASWDVEVSRIYNLEHGPLMSQGEVIGVINTLSKAEDVVLNAAGSMPGDLHKLWRTRNPKGYHMEYGNSTMGYEIVMMNSEIVTAVQEGVKLIIVLVDNHGYASIGGLSKSVGSDGFGTKYRYRSDSGQLDGDTLPVDYAANAGSLGAKVIKAANRDELANAVQQAQGTSETVCIVVETDRRQRVGGYESWWDVAIAEVSENPAVQEARENFEQAKVNERHYL